MDMVVAAAEARRVPFSLSIRVDKQKVKVSHACSSSQWDTRSGHCITDYAGYRQKSRISVSEVRTRRTAGLAWLNLYTRFAQTANECLQEGTYFPGRPPLALQSTESRRRNERTRDQENDSSIHTTGVHREVTARGKFSIIQNHSVPSSMLQYRSFLVKDPRDSDHSPTKRSFQRSTLLLTQAESNTVRICTHPSHNKPTSSHDPPAGPRKPSRSRRCRVDRQ